MSDAVEQSHPWSKYYAERGLSRPGVATLSRRHAASGAEADSGGPPLASTRSHSIDERLAAGAPAVPFIARVRREVAAREHQQRTRTRRVRWVVCATVAVACLHFGVSEVFFRTPSPVALRAHADTLAPVVVALQSAPFQPLGHIETPVTMTDRVSSRRIRYSAEVTMALLEPLYQPATSNGTSAYWQLQQSLQAARATDHEFCLLNLEAHEFPEMPLLIQMVHRAGERITVRVPFEARRYGWRWQFEPPQLALRKPSRAFEGFAIEHYAGTPYIVFGAEGALADIRRRSQLAREYIEAVASEVQRRADAAAIIPLGGGLDENPPALVMPKALARARAATPLEAMAIDPDAPAVDPDAPAIEAPAPAVLSRRAAATAPR